jgi:hypothetical protein
MIPASQARAMLTQFVTDVYKERARSTGFIRSFFPGKQASTRYVSIEVQRGTEKVAVDVVRGSEGNRNKFGRSTQKVFDPPYFREFMELTDLELYDRMIGSDSISESILADFASEIADKLGMLNDKIERKYELMCAQALIDGIITLNNGDNIDFQRKAGSLVSAPVWTTGTNSPYTTLAAGAEFIRKNGKAQGGTYNVILGEDAMTAFLTNQVVLDRADVRNISLESIREPQRNATGATYHGRTSAGSYTFDLWTYPEFYDNESGVSTPYIDDKKIVILPQAPRFHLAYAAVPRLITSAGDLTAQAYVFGEYTDERNTSHIMDIKSAGVPIPVAIDQIYTAQVIA